ncbi:MAG TPA: aminoglycoside phosphotransferase family protein [Acidimicrobiales bacterium]|nr:aminoglycoside phosphotransferase family protein [Acidimicrobiales bacterium]
MTPDAAVAELRVHHGIDLHLEGRCPGGEVGAYYARAEDGSRYVLKWIEGATALVDFVAMAERLTRLRARGYLLPQYWAPFGVSGGVVILQEAAAGAWHDRVTHELVDTVLHLNDLQSGQGGDGHDWSEYVRSTLIEGADGYCLHDTLRHHDSSSRRVLDWVEGVGRSLGPLPDGDVVHLDFHHRNILRQADRVVAVVDWEGSRSGDRVFDLVTFCFGFTHASADAGAETRVWERATALGDDGSLTAYVAHMSLRRLDWSIRHHAGEVARLQEFVLRYIGLVA